MRWIPIYSAGKSTGVPSQQSSTFAMKTQQSRQQRSVGGFDPDARADVQVTHSVNYYVFSMPDVSDSETKGEDLV